jgi:hypothetical protein
MSASTCPIRRRSTPSCPPFEPRQKLDPADPYSIGAMVGPEAFMEVRYLAHDKQMQALDVIPEIAAEFRRAVRPRLRRADPRIRDRWAPRPSSSPSARWPAR